jgi:translation initiation factor 2 subunit 2
MERDIEKEILEITEEPLKMESIQMMEEKPVKTVDEELNDMFSLSKKKKKDKKKDKEKEKDKDKEEKEDEEKKKREGYADPTFEGYSYEVMLERLYKMMNKEEDTGKIKISMPIIERLGSKRVIWTNFQDCAKALNREPDHIMRFFFNYLTTTGNLDGEGKFIFKNVFKAQQIKTTLDDYIKNYVSCKSCKKGNTVFSKERGLTFLNCKNCHASSTVEELRQIYHATTHADRVEAKNKN